MRSYLPFLLSGLGVVANSAAAAETEHGRYACVLGSQGACGSGPEAICLGARIIRGKPQIRLTVDFGQRTATLNDIDGQILKSPSGSGYIIVWDLRLLGSPEVAPYRAGGRTLVGLRLGSQTAEFVCHTSN